MLPSPPLCCSQWQFLSESLELLSMFIKKLTASSGLILFRETIASAVIIWFCIIWESAYIYICIFIDTYWHNDTYILYGFPFDLIDYCLEPYNKSTSLWWTKENSLQRFWRPKYHYFFWPPRYLFIRNRSLLIIIFSWSCGMSSRTLRRCQPIYSPSSFVILTWRPSRLRPTTSLCRW